VVVRGGTGNRQDTARHRTLPLAGASARQSTVGGDTKYKLNPDLELRAFWVLLRLLELENHTLMDTAAQAILNLENQVA
jgi:hypothetical protein